MATKSPRFDAKEALLRATERILAESGHSAITTRRASQEAGVNQGLIKYYFDTLENLLVEVLRRVGARYSERIEGIYAKGGSFGENWISEVRTLNKEFARGSAKVLMELTVLSATYPSLRGVLVKILTDIRRVHEDNLRQLLHELGVDEMTVSVEGLAAMMMTMSEGIQTEKLVGFDRGHKALLAMIQTYLEGLPKAPGRRSAAT
jgi:AcrR family transcriptional regulator